MIDIKNLLTPDLLKCKQIKCCYLKYFYVGGFDVLSQRYTIEFLTMKNSIRKIKQNLLIQNKIIQKSFKICISNHGILNMKICIKKSITESII